MIAYSSRFSASPFL